MAKQSIYEQVTNDIVKQLEQGIAPWDHGAMWNVPEGVSSVGMPVNGVSGNRYRGINVLILWATAWEKGLGSGTWLTFKQVKNLGGSVIKGEKSARITYFDRFTPDDEKQQAKAEGRDAKTVPFIKTYNVFNVRQCEGLPEELMATFEPAEWEAAEPHCEAIIARNNPRLTFDPSGACYIPALDTVQMVPGQFFPEPLDYYRVLFHELTHWTGHEDRLNREIRNKFGSPKYAFEELVAELGAAFISASLGLPSSLRHAEYLDSWIKCLKEDSRAIFKAATLASKAADFILGDGQPKPAPKAPTRVTAKALEGQLSLL